jgi:hypothetical protein
MTTVPFAERAETMPLQGRDIDCVVAVMLKILDGKCKMTGSAKAVMERVYDTVKGRPGQILSADIHEIIAAARTRSDPDLLAQIHRQRVAAESRIPRPVMKAFKARLRRDGLLPTSEDDTP